MLLHHTCERCNSCRNLHRSRQSVNLDNASPPMIRMFLKVPVLMYCVPVTSARTNPLQAAVRSNAAALLAPINAWTCTSKQLCQISRLWDARRPNNTFINMIHGVNANKFDARSLACPVVRVTPLLDVHVQGHYSRCRTSSMCASYAAYNNATTHESQQAGAS